MDCMMELFDRIVDKELTIRRVNVVAVNLISEDAIPDEAPEQLNLFVDYEALEREKEAEKRTDARERKIQEATLAIQGRYGKNSLLKGFNFMEGATTRARNGQIGGHRAGDGSSSPSKQAATDNQAENKEDEVWGGDDA